MLFSTLYFFCLSRRLSVSSIAFFMLFVIVSAYIRTFPSIFLAALPIVCINEVSERKNPSLSASNIATNPHSGISKPSLRRLIPTKTSKVPIRKSRRISNLSKVSISECMYLTLMPFSWRYSVRSSAIFFVSTVQRVLRFLSVTLLTSTIKSSIWESVGRTSISGSIRPVGLIICSVKTPCVWSNSQAPGVADT